MTDFVAGVLPEITLAILGALVAAVGYALRALTVHVLRPWREGQEASTAQVLLSTTLERTAIEVGQAIDHLAATTRDGVAAARRPESPGGTDMTSEEWAALRSKIWAEVKAGAGQDYLARIGDIVSGKDQSLPPASKQALVDAWGLRAVDAIYADRVDHAVAAGLRQPPRAQGQATGDLVGDPVDPMRLSGLV